MNYSFQSGSRHTSVILRLLIKTKPAQICNYISRAISWRCVSDRYVPDFKVTNVSSLGRRAPDHAMCPEPEPHRRDIVSSEIFVRGHTGQRQNNIKSAKYLKYLKSSKFFGLQAHRRPQPIGARALICSSCSRMLLANPTDRVSLQTPLPPSCNPTTLYPPFKTH